MSNLTAQQIYEKNRGSKKEVIGTYFGSKKITLATVKAFIRREYKNGNLYIKQNSTFDGMVDCVMPIENSEWRKVTQIDENNKNSCGINGLWFVRNSRDYFTPYSDDNFIGYKIYNCCGTSVIGMRRLYQ